MKDSILIRRAWFWLNSLVSKNFFRSEYEFKQELVLGIIQKYAMFAAAAPSHLIFTLEGRDAILDNYQVQSTMLGTAKQAVRYNYVCELKKLYWNDGIRWKQEIQESGNLVPTSPTSTSLAKKLHLFMMAKGRDYMTPSVSSIELTYDSIIKGHEFITILHRHFTITKVGQIWSLP